MTAADAPGEALTAALIQISSHAERIAGLDAREAGHYQDIAARLREVADQAAAAGARADGSAADQAAVVAGLDGLDRQVAALASRLAALGDEEDEGGPRYQAVPPPRWWVLSGAERTAAADRLHAWAEQVFRPSYGHLADALPDCWADHPLCLYTLDWLSELWSVLYLSAERTDAILAAQAEWQTRLLPAAAAQMAAEAAGCQHAAGPRRTHPPRSRPGDGQGHIHE